jgi:hypothetical protein
MFMAWMAGVNSPYWFVFADKEDGEGECRGEVEGLVEAAFVGGAVAKKADGHLVGAAGFALSPAPTATGMPPPTIPQAPSTPIEKSAICIEPPLPLQ